MRILICLSVFVLSACIPGQRVTHLNVSSPEFCDAYTVVRTFSGGNADQRLAVDKNNAVHFRFCAKGKEKNVPNSPEG